MQKSEILVCTLLNHIRLIIFFFYNKKCTVWIMLDKNSIGWFKGKECKKKWIYMLCLSAEAEWEVEIIVRNSKYIEAIKNNLG